MTYYFKSLIYLINRFLFARKSLIAVSSKYDLKLKFKTKDGGGRAIYKKGLYEEELSQFIINKIPFSENDIVLDVGANIGWYSLLLSKTIPQKLQVYAFEPDPDNFEYLQFNLRNNQSSGVHAYQKGISNNNESKKLYRYKDSNTGRHSMLNINSNEVINVESTSLDSFVTEQNLDIHKIKLLKIDIEGYEYYAFLGANNLLQNLPYIISEFSPGYMKKGGIKPDNLIDFLFSKDYEPFTIDPTGIKSIATDQLLARNSNINILWKKKGLEI